MAPLISHRLEGTAAPSGSLL